MFSHAKHTTINGGQFTSVNVQAQKDGFERLQEHVAPSAFHNSVQRVDPPRCHENTRTAVIQKIHEWIATDPAARTAWIMWMHGPAGSGKSAIGQSLAEMCISRGIHVASFFFLRTDHMRCSMGPLVATLAYQLCLIMPSAKELISRAIDANPLIFEQSLETQFDELLLAPLRRLRNANKPLSLVLIIDGVDECHNEDHQRDLILTASRILASNNSPLIILFTSRAESHLKLSFRTNGVSRMLVQISLDNHYLPENDIHLYLDESISHIKKTHPFNYIIEPDWPASDTVRTIIHKSSGQFIYASAVIKFISDPRSHPAQQLEIISGLRPVGKYTPFAELDALYGYIFSRVQHINQVTGILAYSILGKMSEINFVANFLRLDKIQIHVALGDLTSVVSCDGGMIRFLHASLPDFLLDSSRSGKYHINAVDWSTRLAIMWFENAARGRFQDLRHGSILRLLDLAEGTTELRASIRLVNASQIRGLILGLPNQYLSAIKKLNLSDKGLAYREQVISVVQFIRKEAPDRLARLDKEHTRHVL